MSLTINPNLIAVAMAAGLDLNRYYKENIRPVNENPADAPENPYWPDTSDLSAPAGIEKAIALRVAPTRTAETSEAKIEGWKLADGFWIGRYRFPGDTSWRYCTGQTWLDIYEG